MLDVLHAALTIIGYLVGLAAAATVLLFLSVLVSCLLGEYAAWRHYRHRRPAPVIPLDSRRRSRHV